MAWAMAKYSTRVRVKIFSVSKVAWSSWRARKVRSERVISDTSEVFFSSSISRLVPGGMAHSSACGRMIRRKRVNGVMFSASAASYCPLGTEPMAPRITSAP